MENPEGVTDLDVAATSTATESVMKKLPEVTSAFWVRPNWAGVRRAWASAIRRER
ncbi:hypothetical protein ACIQVT_01485 [Streptomyces sp. NPDC100445]|uniref:hypothetical protein n=1 Tax=Streptomyces sp. NPDC100445 TaxID=3366102 RepID=UPI0037F75B04